MGQVVEVEVVGSLLGLEGRARPTPTLALGPTPTLVGRPQTSVASPATGSLIASLTGDLQSGCLLVCLAKIYLVTICKQFLADG